jgi:hypothetical protein
MTPRVPTPISWTRRGVAVAGILAACSLGMGGVALAHGAPGGRSPGAHAADHRANGVGGTVSSLNDPAFTVTTRNSTTSTVTTTSDTAWTLSDDAVLTDVTAGDIVRVHRHGTEAAERITILPATPTTTQSQRRNDIIGTVVSNDGTNVVVNTTNGDVTVPVDAETTVTAITTAAFGDLLVGDHVRVTGARDDAGNVAATAVRIDRATAPAKPAGTRPDTTSTAAAATDTASPTTPAALTAASTGTADTATSGDDGSATPTPTPTPTSTAAAAAADGTSDTTSSQAPEVHGTVQDVNDPNFTVTTRRGQVAVVTNASTTYVVVADDGTTSAGTFADVTANDEVTVEGTTSADGTVTATRVVIGDAGRAGCDGDDPRAATTDQGSTQNAQFTAARQSGEQSTTTGETGRGPGGSRDGRSGGRR